jgi:Zn-dependent metalloprotease
MNPILIFVMGLLLSVFGAHTEPASALWSIQEKRLRQTPVREPSSEQLAALERLRQAGGSEPVIRWNEKNWTPTFLSGSLGKVGRDRPAAANKKRAKSLRLSEPAMRDIGAAERFLEENKSLFRISQPKKEFLLKELNTDSLGMRHVKFSQCYKKVPVWAGEIIVHINRQNEITTVTASCQPTPSELASVKERISAKQAMMMATADLEKTTKIEPIPPDVNRGMRYSGPSAEKVIFHERESGQPHVTWMVNVRPNVQDNWYYFVDCVSSEIVFKYNATMRD